MTPIQHSVNLAAVGAYKEAHKIVFDYRRDPETPLEEKISREPWENHLADKIPPEPIDVPSRTKFETWVRANLALALSALGTLAIVVAILVVSVRGG